MERIITDKNIKDGQIFITDYKLKSLDASDCETLKKICIHKQLWLYKYIRLENIYKFHYLEKLSINNCILVEELPFIKNLKVLNAEGCILLKKIPALPYLQVLNLKNAESIKTLSEFPKLTFLDVSYCKSLEKISSYKKLIFLDISGSKNLKGLPYLAKLQQIYCIDSGIDINILKKYEGLRQINGKVILFSIDSFLKNTVHTEISVKNDLESLDSLEKL